MQGQGQGWERAESEPCPSVKLDRAGTSMGVDEDQDGMDRMTHLVRAQLGGYSAKVSK